MRVAPGELRRRETHRGQQFPRPFARFRRRHPMDFGGKGDGVFNRQAGVQGGVGILEHHLHLAAIILQRYPTAEIIPANRFAIKDHLPRAGVQQAHQQAGGGGFAAAAFAHNAQGFTFAHAERDTINRANLPHLAAKQATPDGEMLHEASGFEQRLSGAAAIWGRRGQYHDP